MSLDESGCPIYLKESNRNAGVCGSYPTSCKNVPCRYHSTGDLVYDYHHDTIYRIKSFDRYGNCHIPIFVLEPLEELEALEELESGTTRTSTACWLTRAVDENDIEFYGLSGVYIAEELTRIS